MQEMNNICLINSSMSLASAFESLGKTVLNLTSPTTPFYDLPSALQDNGFVPDLVVQMESLGTRPFLTGLDSLDCLLIFWAVDPHLNSHWHGAYARLFDLTCSTQRSLVSRLKQCGAKDVRWLPPHGVSHPWPEKMERVHPVAFAGRLSEQRPARQWMVDYLRGKVGEFPVEQTLSYPEMMTLYQQTRILPNESILGEVNFRLFEGTACGCLVLTQDLGDEQASLFEPGREIDTYADAAELDEKLDWYLGNERLAEAMGRAAYKRLHAEHLAIHRAQRLLEFAQDTSSNRAVGDEKAKWAAIAVASMWETGMVSLSAGDVLSRLAELRQDADVATSTLRVQAVAGMKSVMEENIQTLLGGKLYTDSLDVNLTGSTAALRLGNWDGAKAFWYRYLQSFDSAKPRPPQNIKDLLSLWAKELKRHGRVYRGGFTYNPECHLPAMAMDCLLSILATEPEDISTLRLMDAMLRPYKELDQVRVGFLSILTLHERSDWRLAFESAMTNLRCYRLESGLDELRLSRELATRQGQERAFSMMLKGRDDSGVISKRFG